MCTWFSTTLHMRHLLVVSTHIGNSPWVTSNFFHNPITTNSRSLYGIGCEQSATRVFECMTTTVFDSMTLGRMLYFGPRPEAIK